MKHSTNMLIVAKGNNVSRNTKGGIISVEVNRNTVVNTRQMIKSHYTEKR